MIQPPPDESAPRPTVLESIAARTGHAPKVLLSDSGSEHGASPVIDPASAASRSLPRGHGKYQLAGEIAHGGMGVILKGHDTDLGRDVALKVLDAELAKNPAVVQRFVEEAQIGGQLQHPGIVPVYELGLMADERPYFTMKLVKGRTLAAHLKQRKSVADNRGRLLAIFEAVCQTMAYAHSKGVLHRDLKPANIMVGAFGEVQVVDWGLAKVLHRGGVADEKRAKQTLMTVIETVRSGPGSSGSDSQVGSVMGTPAYMAPEQAQGEIEKLDERADVFSLGAILCELLTGKPPYEGVEGERTVVQAARGRLDPARARIEGCDADPALKELCLDCLRPAREARPANAEEVARAVHDYLSSVEERAQKAELAAAEARIKAAEERRAKRLTLALATTVVGALTLGGGAYWFVGQERARRAEKTRNAVEAAQRESLELGRAQKPDEALAAARRALVLAETDGDDAALLEHARQFVAQAELDVGAAERERALAAQDRVLLDRLVDLRLKQIDTVGNPRREADLDAAFAQTFHDYGIDLEDGLVAALERIRERDIAEEVALALDDWGRLRRRLLGPQSEKAENLLVLAMDLDPDPERLRLRQAIFDGDLSTMLELSAPESLAKLAPGSIWVLSATLWDGYQERRPDVYRIYDLVLRLHPDDFVLQSIGGNIYHEAGRTEAALMCRAAAFALRPHDQGAGIRQADSLALSGRLTEAERALRACLAEHPSSAEAWWSLGLIQLQLGDPEAALASVTRSLELEENRAARTDQAVMRFFTGQLERDEIERRARQEVDVLSFATCLYALLDHPDPAQRAPEFVLQELQGRSGFATHRWALLVQAIAKVRMEDWAGALVLLEGRYVLPGVMVLTPGAHDFVRSLVYSRLGRAAEARECHARALAGWNTLTGGDMTGWERSDVMRWRREAEAALESPPGR